MRLLVASRTKTHPQAHSAKSTNEPVGGSTFVEWFLQWLQTGTLSKQQAQGGLTVVLAHGGLKVGGRQIFRMRLVRAPLYEEAVADAPEQPGDKHGVRMANPAIIVVLGNVQTLVQAVFDAAKTRPIKLQPLPGVELCGLGTGNEANVFRLAALGLAQQASGLRGQRETNLLRSDRLGPDRAAHVMAFFVREAAVLSGRRFPRGGNPP